MSPSLATCSALGGKEGLGSLVAGEVWVCQPRCPCLGAGGWTRGKPLSGPGAPYHPPPAVARAVPSQGQCTPLSQVARVRPAQPHLPPGHGLLNCSSFIYAL